MKNKEIPILKNSNYCIFCGEEIPEGRMLCPECENTDGSTKSRPHLFYPASNGPEAQKNRNEGTK